MKKSVNDTQIGGNHYKKGGQLQHWDFIAINGLDYLTGCATKYITRNRSKYESPLEDLRKAQHYTEKLHSMAEKKYVTPLGRHIEMAVTVEDFAFSNDLTNVETQIVYDMVHWEQPSDLIDVIMKIQELIDAATFIHHD